uniref:Calpain catalytic domain-containing protein n=1 Tax=Gopherus agassizii TaxID=38772 RepID=A0A452J3Z7_9SAUR
MPASDLYQKLEQSWQTKGRTGSLQSPQKFNNQDFTHLRDYCLSRGLLFEDDTFPAHVSSIGPNLLSEDKLSRLQWKRPMMIERNPHLIVDGVSRFDIIQGEIGDCWVLAALGSLTLQRQFLENVLPKDQGFKENYAGIFHFRFWHFGDWVDVVIDDRLPFLNGRYLSVQPRSRNEFWPSLLEKAYAKLRGSYQNLHWGYISDALVDLTGGVQVQFLLQKPPSDLQEIIKAAAKSQCLMGCTMPGGQSIGKMELKNGLVKGHAYTVTGATEIPYKNGWEDIIRVWNPWGHGEWRGPWSDGSPQWDRVPAEYKKDLCEDKDDGEFWMSGHAFAEQFFSLCICNNTPSFLDFGDQRGTRWSLAMYVNQWARGLTAGGSAFSRNPQYFVQVEEPDLKNYNVVVSLIRKPVNNMPDAQILFTGFLIFRVSSIRWYGVAFFSQYKYKVLKYGFNVSTRDVTNYFYLSPGTYVVVPTTSEEGQEAEFLLRIFLRQAELFQNGFQDIFRRVEGTGSGFLDISDLKNAVQRAGLAVNGQLLHLTALRYSDSSMRICLPDFVCCMIRLETMASKSCSWLARVLWGSQNMENMGLHCINHISQYP